MRVVVASAHPDDETLGAGGTLLLHGAAGDEIHWLIATRAGPPRWDAETVRQKEAEIQDVAAAYGMRSVRRLPFGAAEIDRVPIREVIEAVASALDDVRPDRVYTVHPGDVHSDHRVLFEALQAAAKPFRRRAGPSLVLAWETLSSSHQAFAATAPPFRPQVYVPLTADILEAKIAMMERFRTETQEDPLPRGPAAIRAQARIRGAEMGVEYAEAFEVLRGIERIGPQSGD